MTYAPFQQEPPFNPLTLAPAVYDCMSSWVTTHGGFAVEGLTGNIGNCAVTDEHTNRINDNTRFISTKE